MTVSLKYSTRSTSIHHARCREIGKIGKIGKIGNFSRQPCTVQRIEVEAPSKLQASYKQAAVQSLPPAAAGFRAISSLHFAAFWHPFSAWSCCSGPNLCLPNRLPLPAMIHLLKRATASLPFGLYSTHYCRPPSFQLASKLAEVGLKDGKIHGDRLRSDTNLDEVLGNSLIGSSRSWCWACSCPISPSYWSSPSTNQNRQQPDAGLHHWSSRR